MKTKLILTLVLALSSITGCATRTGVTPVEPTPRGAADRAMQQDGRRLFAALERLDTGPGSE
jgi:hypothetical protein